MLSGFEFLVFMTQLVTFHYAAVLMEKKLLTMKFNTGNLRQSAILRCEGYQKLVSLRKLSIVVLD